MPTKPLETILDRDLSEVAAKDLINVASPLLQELVNYSTNVFARCATSTSGRINEDLAVLMLYLHIIEMTDGIEVLISKCCPIPAMPLLRSSFEALLSIEYILEDDYVNRSLAWLASYMHERIAMYEALEPATNRGKEYLRLIQDDEMCQNLSFPPAESVHEWIDNLASLLESPQFAPMEQEFEEQRTRRKRKPNWYKLFGGATNLRQLAIHLHRGGQYEILYRHWSRIVHGNDLSRFLTRTEGGEQAIQGLRNPNDIKFVTSYASNFILNSTRLILGKFRPGEDWSKWYIREVSERYRLITG